MTRRHLLRKHLFTAWHTTITNQYCDRLINSERGLQVFFCAALLQQFEKGKVMRRIFVEPRISRESAPGVLYPDIVLCNSRQIIGVVELKYVPRGLPKYAKDLRTSRNIAKVDGITLSNDRYRGIERNRFYTLASDAVLCWAGVYTGSQHPRGGAHPCHSRGSRQARRRHIVPGTTKRESRCLTVAHRLSLLWMPD
jgi:hypothetical protein